LPDWLTKNINNKLTFIHFFNKNLIYLVIFLQKNYDIIIVKIMEHKANPLKHELNVRSYITQNLSKRWRNDQLVSFQKMVKMVLSW